MIEWWDWWIVYNEYVWKSRSEVEVYVRRFAEEAHWYLLQYDAGYKNDLDETVQQWIEKWGNSAEIQRWLKDWVVEWTTSYIMDYYDIYTTLRWLTLAWIYEGMRELYDRAKDFVSSPLSHLQWFIDQLVGIKEKILTMDGYERWKSTTYVWSNVWLNSVDPASKVTTALWAGMVVRVNKYTSSLQVINILKKVEVRKTLDRIKNNKIAFQWHDNTIFENTDLKLPKKESWYYKRLTVNTRKWSERIVIGEWWEIHYTNDHYDTFIELK